MAKIPVQEIGANYDDDRSMLVDLIQVIDLDYQNGQFTFTFSIGEDGHYVNVTVDEDDLNHAIQKAKDEEETIETT